MENRLFNDSTILTRCTRAWPLTLITCLAVVLALQLGCGKKSEDVLIFRVNGEDVFKSELDLLARNGMVKAGIQPGSAESEEWLKEHVENLYESLIKLYLIQQEAQATLEPPSGEEVDQAIEGFKGVFPSPDEYARFVELANLSPADMRVIFRNKILAERFQTAKREESKKVPTLEEMRAWYERHVDEFRAPDNLRLRHILFLVKGDATPEERIAVLEKAEQVRRSLTGADEQTFARVAQEKSDDLPTASYGGDLGFVTQQTARAAYPAGLAESIFKLRKGEISPVLQSQLGYHIFMVVDDTQEFEEAVEDIKTRLEEESMAAGLLRWMVEARKKAAVEIVVQPRDLYAEATPVAK